MHDRNSEKQNKYSSSFRLKISALGAGALLICAAALCAAFLLNNNKKTSEAKNIRLITETPEPTKNAYSVSAVAVPVVDPTASTNEGRGYYHVETAAPVKQQTEGMPYSTYVPQKIITAAPAKTQRPVLYYKAEDPEELELQERETEEPEEFGVPETIAGPDIYLGESPSLQSAVKTEKKAEKKDGPMQPEIDLSGPSPTPTVKHAPAETPRYVSLKKHDSSAQVAKLQDRLMQLGYLDIDEPTDYFGTVTETAVKLFQRQHGLGTDGVAGEQTQQLLFSDNAEKYCMKIGTEGKDVKALQQQLCDLGYLGEKDIDSVYGDTTVSAVREFQVRNKLTADGLAGEKTIEILYSEGAEISYALYKERKEAAASASAAAVKKKTTATPKSRATSTPQGNPKIDAFISAARGKLGCEYILGDSGPDTFDCSGFVCWCLRKAGVSVQRLNAAGYSAKSSWSKITEIDKLKKGDILFFKSDSGSHVNHCGIYIGSNMMIDASSGNGKVIKRPLSSYWKRNFVCARRPWN